jgi:hypothetical protein
VAKSWQKQKSIQRFEGKGRRATGQPDGLNVKQLPRYEGVVDGGAGRQGISFEESTHCSWLKRTRAAQHNGAQSGVITACDYAVKRILYPEGVFYSPARQALNHKTLLSATTSILAYCDHSIHRAQRSYNYFIQLPRRLRKCCGVREANATTAPPLQSFRFDPKSTNFARAIFCDRTESRVLLTEQS